MEIKDLDRVKRLSKVKLDLLLTCLYALECVDDKKVEPLNFDIEEDCSPTREAIYIKSQSTSFSVEVNGKNVIDDNIEW